MNGMAIEGGMICIISDYDPQYATYAARANYHSKDKGGRHAQIRRDIQREPLKVGYNTELKTVYEWAQELVRLQNPTKPVIKIADEIVSRPGHMLNSALEASTQLSGAINSHGLRPHSSMAKQA